MLLLISIIAALCAPALRLVLGRPRFVPPPGDFPPADTISIIIPARNEEASLGDLLESILRQPAPPLELIVVDDASTDATAAIAAANGARVISPPGIPPDWKGKTWACQQGADAARGDWLLFLDADTRLEPGGLAAIAGLARDPARVSSICPHHTVRRPYEQLSAFFNVVTLAGVNTFGIQRDPSHECALFGQCLLIPRSIYQQAGGHASVRTEILENFEFARRIEALGIPRDCHLGRGCIRMRMFPGGFGDLWSSWKKGCASGAGNTAPRALALTSIWITGAMLAGTSGVLALTPLVPPLHRIAGAAAYLLFAAQCARAFRLAGNFALAGALLFPIPLLFYQILFFTAVIERKLGVKTRWKGRHVD